MLFDPLREQIAQLIGMFGVDAQAATILAGFDALCGESLRVDARRCVPELSRINVDGTPFQYSLSLGCGRRAALQFLGEAGRPGCEMVERLKAGRTALVRLAEICDVMDAAVEIQPLLDIAAPPNDRELLVDHAGAFWFALSCQPGRSPAMTVYINCRWGSHELRWWRLQRFASFFDALDSRRSLRAAAALGLAPLGMAITFSRGEPPSGRSYLSAYGVPMNSYHSLFADVDGSREADAAFDAFERHVIAEDAEYPTRSAVFSVELAPTKKAAPKLELCAHCAFDDDVNAAERISEWLQASGLDDGIYRSVLQTLTAARPLSRSGFPTVHAYVGVGSRSTGQYASIYLNPGPGLACM